MLYRLLILAAVSVSPAFAQSNIVHVPPGPGEPVGTSSLGPAPTGDPLFIAKTVISRQFDNEVCKSPHRAERLADGSIRAYCANDRGEEVAYRVFYHERMGNMAMSCAAAARLRVSGC